MNKKVHRPAHKIFLVFRAAVTKIIKKELCISLVMNLLNIILEIEIFD